MTATLEHVYEPWGGCLEAFNARDPEVLISGPAGTGKSRACLEKVHTMALRNPGFRGLLVRKTAVSLTNTGLVTWNSFVIPETVEAGAVEWYGGSSSEPAQYRYSNGSAVMVGGMDRATRILSSEYDVVYVQEATELTETDWETITTRLRGDSVSFTQLIADCNPERPTHWLKKRCDRGDTLYIQSRHEDNPTLFNRAGEITTRGASYLERLDKLTGTRLAVYRHGQWVAAEGGIYPEYETAIHLVDRRDIPAEWNRYWAIDFGFVNPFVCQMWAEQPDGELVLYREYYGTRRTVTEWGQLIADDITDDAGEWVEPRPVAIISDHDAEGREAFYRVIGQQTVPAIKRVSDGIQAVQQRLKDRRLLFMRDALAHPPDQALLDAAKPTCTVEEFGGYIWADGKTKEQPVKEDDHGMDAARYMVAQRDLGSRPGIRLL